MYVCVYVYDDMYIYMSVYTYLTCLKLRIFRENADIHVALDVAMKSILKCTRVVAIHPTSF